MLTRVVIRVLAIVAVTLLSAVAAMLLLSQAYGSREYASMVIWCSIAVGVIGGYMIAGSVVFRRSNDVHLRLTVYPMRPDLAAAAQDGGPAADAIRVMTIWNTCSQVSARGPGKCPFVGLVNTTVG